MPDFRTIHELAAGLAEGEYTSRDLAEASLEEIAKTKLPDLNCTSIESAMRIIEGTARNMGVSISD